MNNTTIDKACFDCEETQQAHFLNMKSSKKRPDPGTPTSAPLRRSSRDTNSIRLASSGTFYRRMRTLFFSNPSEKEYEEFLKKGSRRRGTTDYSKSAISSASPSASVIDSGSSTCSAQEQSKNEIKVRRATVKPYPEEASIYVIDNFLTEAELVYFDRKIATIPFERSFVDNAECYGDDEDDYDDTSDDDTCAGDDAPDDNDKEKRVNCDGDGDGDGDGNEGKEEKNGIVNNVKKQKVSGVYNISNASVASAIDCSNGKEDDINNKVATTTNKNDNDDGNGDGNVGKEKNDAFNIVKEQKVSGDVNNTSLSTISTSPCNNGKAEDVNNEVGTTTHKNGNGNEGKERHDTVNIVKEQKFSEVYNNKTSSSVFSTSSCNNGKTEDVNNKVGTTTHKNDSNDDDRNGDGNESKGKNDCVNIVKEQKVSEVYNNTNASAISTSTCNNREEYDINNEVGMRTTNKNNNNDKSKNIKGKKREKKDKRQPATLVDDSHRTSTFYSFKKSHDSKISALERRIATMLGCWVHQIEALQLVRYQPGEFFGIHHDLGNLLDDDTVQLPPKDHGSKRRLVTLFCYLNTLQDDEGGCTYFPNVGSDSHLRVKPKRGRAVLWSNIGIGGKPDPKTIHAGETVISTTRSSCSNGGNSNSNSNSNSNINNSSDSHQGNNEKDDIQIKYIGEGKGEAGTKKYGLNIWVCEE